MEKQFDSLPPYSVSRATPQVDETQKAWCIAFESAVGGGYDGAIVLSSENTMIVLWTAQSEDAWSDYGCE